jgi:hypothetical protein
LIVNWLKYHYDFSAPPKVSSRTFTLVGLEVGASIAYHFNRNLSMDSQAALSLPLSNIRLLTVDVGLSYRLNIFRHAHISPRIAVGWIQLDYKDEQAMPNHIRYIANPYGSLGFILAMDH